MEVCVSDNYDRKTIQIHILPHPDLSNDGDTASFSRSVMQYSCNLVIYAVLITLILQTFNCFCEDATPLVLVMNGRRFVSNLFVSSPCDNGRSNEDVPSSQNCFSISDFTATTI